MTYTLIIDDDPEAQRLISRLLDRSGIPHQKEEDGARALETVRENPPALILLDLMMPGMDGFTVYYELRSDPRTRYIPVIVATSCSDDQIDMLRLPGVHGVVNKGSMTELARLVSSVYQ